MIIKTQKKSETLMMNLTPPLRKIAIKKEHQILPQLEN